MVQLEIISSYCFPQSVAKHCFTTFRWYTSCSRDCRAEVTFSPEKEKINKPKTCFCKFNKKIKKTPSKQNNTDHSGSASTIAEGHKVDHFLPRIGYYKCNRKPVHCVLSEKHTNNSISSWTRQRAVGKRSINVYALASNDPLLQQPLCECEEQYRNILSGHRVFLPLC